MSSSTIPSPASIPVALRLQPEAWRLGLVVAIATAVMVPTFLFGIPSNRDLINHFRFALPFFDSLKAGHLHPGWLAESNSGYGDASFRFYPPALYYLLSIFRLLTGDWHAATLLTFTSIFITGALGIYGWTRTLFSSSTALWASTLFTLAPYHLNQFYQASMLAEFAACSVLPFVFWFVERTCQKRSLQNVAGLAIAYSLLILTHLPLAVIGSLALLVYGLIRLQSPNYKSQIAALGTAVGLGLLASACYWVTMIAEKNWIRADSIQADPSVDYRKNFLFSTFSPDNLNVWWMNILVLFSLAMFCPALLLLRRSIRENLPRSIAPLLIVLILAMLMATPLTLPVWWLFRPLQETQFPWRWLGILSMVAPILTAASIPGWLRLARGKWRPVSLLALSGVAISLAFSFSHIVREAKFLSPAEFRATLNSIPGSTGVTQWLPVWAKDNVKKINNNVDIPGRTVQIDSWQPEKRVFSISAGEAAEARVKTYYYPHWVAKSSGQNLQVNPSEDGVLLISVPGAITTVSLEFIEPLRVTVADLLSILGWLSIATLLVCNWLKSRAKNCVPRESTL
jgi:uncharacterized membrane protein